MAIQYGNVTVSWLGHDGFLIESDGKRLYIDPHQINGRETPAADYLLITHSHHDHLSAADIEQLVTPETIVVCPPDCSSKLTKFRMKALKTLEPGGEYEDETVHVLAVPAYNKDKPFHPRENDWLGYVVTLGEVSIYHAGDTDRIPEMGDIECTIALLPISGTYVMTAEEAAAAVADMKTEVAIPMHWGAIIGTREDAEKFKKLVGNKAKVVILEKE